MLGGIGAFAGLVDVSALKAFDRPLLASSTDGVGTKIAIARELDVHHTIGRDLVGMVVDDIIVVGAEPLAMTDYIACGTVVPERIADIVRGIAEGCQLAGCALVGGETAEHPGMMAPEDYDVAGAAVGVVEAADVLGPERVRHGDVVIGMDASGLHSNGYSLVRAVISAACLSLGARVEDFGRTLGEELLEPTRIYTADLLAVLRDARTTGAVHALSHVTGGGLAANLARVMPRGLAARIDRSRWEPGAVFSRVVELGFGAAAGSRGHPEHGYRHGRAGRGRHGGRDARGALGARPRGPGDRRGGGRGLAARAGRGARARRHAAPRASMAAPC